MKQGFVVVVLVIGLLAVMAASSFAQTAPRTDAWVPGLASFIKTLQWIPPSSLGGGKWRFAEGE